MAELNYRRNREFQIFTWSASILIAIIGALLIRAQGSSTLFTNRGAYWKLVAGLVVTGVTFFSVNGNWNSGNSRRSQQDFGNDSTWLAGSLKQWSFLVLVGRINWSWLSHPK